MDLHFDVLSSNCLHAVPEGATINITPKKLRFLETSLHCAYTENYFFDALIAGFKGWLRKSVAIAVAIVNDRATAFSAVYRTPLHVPNVLSGKPYSVSINFSVHKAVTPVNRSCPTYA